MGRYHHLTRAERERIFRLHDAKVPACRIAQELGRHASTIYRELRRNYFFDEDPYFRGYFASVAHDKARGRRMRGGQDPAATMACCTDLKWAFKCLVT